MQPTGFIVDDVVGAMLEQWTRDGCCGIVAGHILFFPPHLSEVNARTNPISVPQRGFQTSAIQSPVGTELPAPRRQLRGLLKQLRQHCFKLLRFGCRSLAYLDRQWNFITGITNDMQ